VGVKHYFPTWWTMCPLRTPLLTAWQGGPKAQELADWPLEKRVEEALKTLAHLSRKSVKWLRQELKGVHTHNWSSDPNSFGAYSYVRKDGVRPAKFLNQPVENTLYFAGEGFCSTEPARGTVHGALESGFKAADKILDTIRI
jgi:monoamine oxidase